MTIAEMRTLLGLSGEVSDAAVVEAYVAYLGDASAGAIQSEPPVDVDRAKRQLSITSSDDDDLLTELIAAATDHVERQTGLVLSRREVIETVRPDRERRLRSWPIVSVDAVLYRGRDDVEQLLAIGLHRLDVGRRPGALIVSPATPHPARCVPLTVVMTAGYAAPEEVPATVLQAILVLVAEFYANREAGAISDTAQRSLNWLLRPHKVRVL